MKNDHTQMGHNESGAVIAEAALTMLVLFTLLFAILSFGVGFSAYQSMTNAAREGARFAIAPDPNDSYKLPSPALVAQKVCSYLNGSAGRVGTCANYNGGTAPPGVGGACVVNGGAIPTTEDVYVTECNVAGSNGITEKYLEVDLRKPVTLSFLPFIKVNLKTSAVMRSENN